MPDFDEYKRQGELERAEKAGIWQTAIGLQQVDGLVPSAYLYEAARENIEGKITLEEVQERLNEYYVAEPMRASERAEEADKVSARIAVLLSEKTFTFSPAEYITIHKRLFSGLYKFAGEIRDWNITKAEWVLDGQTVFYASADSIRATLDYDFARERAFSYKGLSPMQVVEHFAAFISSLWQIHAFGEGNTRTTAVFAIKHLRTIGFDVTNDLFAENSWYFRNALVRANYNDYKNGIHSTPEYLNRFFENLILGTKHQLKNRELHIATANEDNGTVNALAGMVNGTVFSFIQENPHYTAEQLATALGKSVRTVRREIKRLKETGCIVREGSDKRGFWKVLRDAGLK